MREGENSAMGAGASGDGLRGRATIIGGAA